MHRVQELMCGHTAVDPYGEKIWMPPMIQPKFSAATSCPVPTCTSCELSRVKSCNPKVIKQEAIKERQVVLAWDKCEAGDFVSVDQFVVKTPD